MAAHAAPATHPAAWGFALALHGAVLMALWPQPRMGGAPPGFGVVFAEMGQGGGQVGGTAMTADAIPVAEDDVPLLPEMQAETPPVAEPPPPVLAEEPPVAEPPPVVAEMTPPEPVPEPEAIPEPAPTVAEALPPEPVAEAEPIVEPPPAVAAPPPRPVVTPRPTPPPVAAPRPTPPRTAPPRQTAARPAPARPASSPAPAGQATASAPAGDPSMGAPGSANPQGGASPMPRAAPGALLPDQYRAGLSAALRRHLRYPMLARERGLEGEVIVQFSVARDGAVRGVRILRSSGVGEFDNEAVALLARVSPLPPLPGSWPAEEAMFAAPIRFSLR